MLGIAPLHHRCYMSVCHASLWSSLSSIDIISWCLRLPYSQKKYCMFLSISKSVLTKGCKHSWCICLNLGLWLRWSSAKVEMMETSVYCLQFYLYEQSPLGGLQNLRALISRPNGSFSVWCSAWHSLYMRSEKVGEGHLNPKISLAFSWHSWRFLFIYFLKILVNLGKWPNDFLKFQAKT